MSFKLPSADQVRQIGDELGMELTADYANGFINYIRPFADGFRLLAALPDDVPAVKYPRGAYYRPQGDENKYGAWIVKTHIKGAPGGRLAGKKVAIKDTYAIAGVPLTNGASVLEGFVPEFDATIVTRLLDAGAEIVGKSVCEYFSFSGGAATSTSGPVQNPRAWGHTPWRILDRIGRPGRGRRSRHGDRRRPGRLDPDSGLAVRCGRHQTDLGPRSLYRHHGHGSDHRSRRTLDRDGSRERAFPRSHGRRGRLRFPAKRPQARHLHQGNRARDRWDSRSAWCRKASGNTIPTPMWMRAFAPRPRCWKASAPK